MKPCKKCSGAPVVNSGKCRTCYNEYMTAYMTARYHRRRAEWVSRLGGECSVCGLSEGLEFDHKDASGKMFDVAKILSGGSASKVEMEMSKCHLLCTPHHLEKTLREGDIISVEHGGGLSGKKNCPCSPCKTKKARYMKSYNRKT